MRTIHPGALHWAMLVGVTACGEVPDASGDAKTVVRDSAGITIVENHAAPSSRWRLSDQPLIQIDDGLPVEQSPLDPTAVFSGADGGVVVGDGNQVGWHAILIYDDAGEYVTKLGGPGRGPGEFGGQLWWAGAFRGDSLVAWDRGGPSGPSIKVFGPDGGYSRDVTMPRLERTRPEGTTGHSLGFHGVFSDGSFLTSSYGVLDIPQQPGPTSFRHALLVVDPGGLVWDTVGEFGLAPAYWDGQSQNSYLFGSPGIVRPYGNDVLLGTSTTYEYRVVDRSGAVRLIVRRDHEVEPVTPEDVESVVSRFLENVSRSPGVTEERLAQMRRTVEDYPRATTKPAYSSILVAGSGNVWVERFRWLDPWGLPPDPAPTLWDVFAPEGEWVATVDVPAAVLLLSVSGDRAFGVRVDDLDVRHVVVFQIVKP